MTQISYATDQRAVKTAAMLGGLALITALIAALAGVVLLISNPDSGSTAESTLGVIAAVAGLSTAALAVGTLIYAQVKNLWRYVPTWIRSVAIALLAVAVVFSIVRSIVQN